MTEIYYADCTLEMVGRATTTAERAVRILIIKDKSVIVHKLSEGIKPINYMPYDKQFDICYTEDKDGNLVITTSNTKDKLIITVHNILNSMHISTDEIIDDGITHYASEKHVQQIVVNHLNDLFPEAELISEQYRCDTQAFDILLKNKETQQGIIVEIKRHARSITIQGQLLRYKEVYTNNRPDFDTSSLEPRLVLVALEFSDLLKSNLVEIAEIVDVRELVNNNLFLPNT